MAKTHKITVKEEFEVGHYVTPFTYRKCYNCCSWFKFRYDKGAEAIRKYGYYKIVCPICDSEYVYEREDHIPTDHMKFVEVE